MGAPNKPGVDWSSIEQRFLAGESAYSLAQEFDVSKQAILQRKDREGWGTDHRQQRQRSRWAEQIAELPSLKVLEDPATRSQQLLAAQGNRTPEKALVLVEAFSQSHVKAVAARAARMSVETLNRWLEEDQDFAALCDEVQANRLIKHSKNINDAGDRGDPRASLMQLQSHPWTKPHYSTGENQRTGPSITVVLNIPDPGNPESPKPLIDISPSQE